MDSRMDEPAAKRSRAVETDGENADKRTIELNLNKYAKWVRDQTDEQLVSIFEIGLKIKESVVLTVDVSRDFLGKTLTSQMEPVINSIEKEVKLQLQAVQTVQGNVTQVVSNQVNKMSTEVQSFKSDVKTDIAKIGQEFQSKVDDVVSKASSLKTLDEQIGRSEKRLTDHITLKMKECSEELTKITSSLKMSHVKGSVGEVQVTNVLKEAFPNFTVTDTSKQPRCGDILVETTQQNKIMIEVKNRESSNVPQKDVERFKDNLANSPNIKVGIFLSMKSGIVNKASNGKFQVKFDENQYQIYVPNACRQENLIVWSVLLADELAKAMRGDLGSSQDQMLKQLYDDFEESKQLEKTCRDNLKSLEKSAESVTSSLDAILKTVEKTRKKLKSLLND